jgi:hypothetical protein
LRPKKQREKDSADLDRNFLSDVNRNGAVARVSTCGFSWNYLSTMERGTVEIGAEILLRIGREFVKPLECC